MDFMMGIFKTVYNTFGVQHPKTFVLVFAIFGFIIFAFIACLVVFGPAETKDSQKILITGGGGGNATVTGNNSSATGGAGGKAEVGPGGKGGDAHINGDLIHGRGGEGGNSPQWDGRGGRRAASPLELENADTSMWKFGAGGAGANAPEYNRRLRMLTVIRQEYIKEFPDQEIFIQAGIDTVPINWINKKLQEINESWRVNLENGGYKLPPL